jgi:DNA-binding XRE family transcriptional regulator
VTAFLLRECSRLALASAKGLVIDLRSLLWFLFLERLTPAALATAVPPVAGWRDTGLPATLAASEVGLLLDSCDRTPPFAELLRQHRLALGLTQGELAERAGLSERAISDLERGLKRAPRASTVQLLVHG